jgi:ABC-type multidrug transport system fused ATPase/permease subunit
MDAGTILEGEIKEVDVKVMPFHETTVAEWHLSDNHEQILSFSDVRPADITVRNLEVEVNIANSFVDILKAKFTNPKVDGDVAGKAQRKKILKDISADFPAGTMTAIIGGSGSGKVRFYLCTDLQSQS